VVAAWTAKVLRHIHTIEQQATDAMKDGYEGERNEAGEYHGQGAFRYLETGEVYEGSVRGTLCMVWRMALVVLVAVQGGP